MLIGLLAFGLLLAAAVVAYNVLSDRVDAPENIAETVGDLQRAPDFVMEDIDGNEIRLSDFLGRPVVLNFWTTWCPSCVREIPYFEWLYQDDENDVQVLKVNLIGSRGETHSTVESFMQAGGYTFPLYFDTVGEGAREYNVRAIPATFFITSEGYIAANVQGAVNETTLQSGLDLINTR